MIIDPILSSLPVTCLNTYPELFSAALAL